MHDRDGGMEENSPATGDASGLALRLGLADLAHEYGRYVDYRREEPQPYGGGYVGHVSGGHHVLYRRADLGRRFAIEERSTTGEPGQTPVLSSWIWREETLSTRENGAPYWHENSSWEVDPENVGELLDLARHWAQAARSTARRDALRDAFTELDRSGPAPPRPGRGL